MSEPAGMQARSALPFADRVVIVGTDQPFRWLAAGWRDFRAAWMVSLPYGAMFAVAGLLLSLGLTAAGMLYLVGPLAVGFLLVGPALTVGFHGVSRDLGEGRGPALAAAFSAWRANPGPLLSLGLLQVVFLVVWMRFAAVIFAVCFTDVPSGLQGLVNAALFTADGWTFLMVGTAVGAFMAALAFGCGAFSLPLLLDRRVGVLEAVVTSAVAAVLNAPAMLVWGGLVVLFTAAGLALGYVGLVVTLPLIGHASWHAYRAVLRAA